MENGLVEAFAYPVSLGMSSCCGSPHGNRITKPPPEVQFQSGAFSNKRNWKRAHASSFFCSCAGAIFFAGRSSKLTRYWTASTMRNCGSCLYEPSRKANFFVLFPKLLCMRCLNLNDLFIQGCNLVMRLLHGRKFFRHNFWPPEAPNGSLRWQAKWALRKWTATLEGTKIHYVKTTFESCLVKADGPHSPEKIADMIKLQR